MNEIDDIIKYIAETNATILNEIDEFEAKLGAVILSMLKKFSAKNGLLEPSSSDFATIQEIEKRIEKAIKELGYLKIIDNFLPAIDNIERDLLRVIPRVNPKINFSKDIVNLAQDRKLVIESLALNLNSPTSIKANIKAPLKRIISNAVNNRMPYEEAVRIVKNYTGIDSEKGGRLKRYVQQVSTDALNQWSGTVSGKVAANYGIVDFIYSGGTKTTSRPQCRRWLHNKYTDEKGKQRRGYGGYLTREMIEHEMQRAAKSVGRKTLDFAGYSSFAYPTLNNFATIRGGHNCDDFATPYKMTIQEAEKAINKYNAIEGTNLIAKYNEYRFDD